MSNSNANPAPPAPAPAPATTRTAVRAARQHGPLGSDGARLRQCAADTARNHRRTSPSTVPTAHVTGTLGAMRVIAVNGEIDLSTAGTLYQHLKTLAGPAPQWIALDLSQVAFIDCTGLHALNDLAQLARDSGGAMGISAVSRAAALLFELADWPGWK